MTDDDYTAITPQEHCGKNFGILFLEMVHYLWPLAHWGGHIPQATIKYALERTEIYWHAVHFLKSHFFR